MVYCNDPTKTGDAWCFADKKNNNVSNWMRYQSCAWKKKSYFNDDSDAMWLGVKLKAAFLTKPDMNWKWTHTESKTLPTQHYISMQTWS